MEEKTTTELQNMETSAIYSYLIKCGNELGKKIEMFIRKNITLEELKIVVFNDNTDYDGDRASELKIGHHTITASNGFDNKQWDKAVRILTRDYHNQLINQDSKVMLKVKQKFADEILYVLKVADIHSVKDNKQYKIDKEEDLKIKIINAEEKIEQAKNDLNDLKNKD